MSESKRAYPRWIMPDSVEFLDGQDVMDVETDGEGELTRGLMLIDEVVVGTNVHQRAARDERRFFIFGLQRLFHEQ